MTHEGTTQNYETLEQATHKTHFDYNGIEKVEDLDLNVNMAFYRTLDPELGRW